VGREAAIPDALFAVKDFSGSPIYKVGHVKLDRLILDRRPDVLGREVVTLGWTRA